VFSSRLKQSGIRCEGVVVARRETSVTKGAANTPSARRVWELTIEVRPPDGRTPFTVEETVGVPIGSQPWTTGSVVPTWVHPTKDKAHVELDGAAALQTALNARLAAAGITVDIPDGVTDPAEMQRIIAAQIEAQRRDQQQ
jgi:hypothetical protein